MANQKSKSKLSSTLSIVLGIILLGTIGAFFYTTTSLESYDHFTEFYILSQDGEANAYPVELKAGEETGIIIGINNLEKESISYKVEIKTNGEDIGVFEPITLSPEEKFEGIAYFTINKSGDRQKVEFLLYKEGQTENYESLHLWVDVNE